jgi:hypothetical protein
MRRAGTAVVAPRFYLKQQTGGDTMIGRNILAAAAFALVTATATAALAEVGVQLKTPGGNLDVNVGSQMTPSDAWIGRALYSSDGKYLGEVSGTARDQVYADIGGFLGFGATHVRVDGNQVQEVKNDRIVLKLNETEANSLPPVDEEGALPQ